MKCPECGGSGYISDGQGGGEFCGCNAQEDDLYQRSKIFWTGREGTITLEDADPELVAECWKALQRRETVTRGIEAEWHEGLRVCDEARFSKMRVAWAEYRYDFNEAARRFLRRKQRGPNEATKD